MQQPLSNAYETNAKFNFKKSPPPYVTETSVIAIEHKGSEVIKAPQTVSRSVEFMLKTQRKVLKLSADNALQLFLRLLGCFVPVLKTQRRQNLQQLVGFSILTSLSYNIAIPPFTSPSARPFDSFPN